MIETRQQGSTALQAPRFGSRVSGGPGCGGVRRRRKPRAQLTTIMELRRFDFSSIKLRNEVYVVLCPAVCVLPYTRVRLSVRIHALTMSSGQLLQFLVWSTLPSDEDPAQEFVDASPLTSASITSTTGAPSLVTSAIGYDPDAYLKISLRAVQAPASTPPLSATLSACLLLRSG